ncbi:MAG: hypothetical protein U0031_09400 [Thermomicrobiales bacterium]
MSALERLRQAISAQEDALRAAVPADRPAAIAALVRTVDQLSAPVSAGSDFDLVTGQHLPNLGGAAALRLCLESSDAAATGPTLSIDQLEAWAERFLRDCAALEAAQQVLAHVETGFMRLVEDGQNRFAAWIGTKLAPASWRERADIAWWHAMLAHKHRTELEEARANLGQAHRTASNMDTVSRRFADIHLRMMADQIGFPPDAVLGGCSYRTYQAVLRQLIAMASAARNRDGAPEPHAEASLIAALASALTIDPAMIATALAALTLDEQNAAYHAATPDVMAPLVRVSPDRVVWSVHGLTTRPILFLHRELRRRAAAEYHTNTATREDLFRQDFYALFTDKRFVTSPGRIALRRERGDLRTDVDAVVFDRKTGALGLFELKWQDPFARSTAESTRQGETMLHANRQVAGILDWINRHGADEILNRVDARTARTFRVQKVVPFVVGRYLMHLGAGAVPDRRIAWATWPQVLRLVDGQPVGTGGGNPLASLFTRLRQADAEVRFPSDASSREIDLRTTSLIVHPSFAAFQAASETRK